MKGAEIINELTIFNEIFSADDIIRYCEAEYIDSKEDVICQIIQV
jgi:hypothetical protein